MGGAVVLLLVVGVWTVLANTNAGAIVRPGRASVRTATYSTARLDELLAQLGYLPLTWTPKTGSVINPGRVNAELSAAYQAPAGTFSWSGDYPSNLKDQWK